MFVSKFDWVTPVFIELHCIAATICKLWINSQLFRTHSVTSNRREKTKTQIIGTACIICGAGSMKWYSVHPSVCPSIWSSHNGPTAANPLLQICCCGPGRQELSIDCCSSSGANAGSATLSAYVGCWTQTCSSWVSLFFNILTVVKGMFYVWWLLSVKTLCNAL